MLAAWAVFWASWALIAYTYAGYPLLLACAARLRRDPSGARPPLQDDELPSVSIVLAAYNEGEVIAAKLRNCADLDYPPDRIELLVGSDGSTDSTNSVLSASAGPRRRLIAYPERRGKVSVLNDLVALAEGDILLMTDASTMLAPDALRRLVDHFQDSRVGCVTGELSIAADGDVSGEGFYLRYERWMKRSEGRLGCVVGCVGAIFVMRRDLYEPLPPSTICEDLVLCLRVMERGFRAESEPAARAVDPPCATARDEMGRKVRIGAGDYQALGLAAGLLHPRHGIRAFAFWGHKVLRWMVPFCLITSLAANALILESSVGRAALAVQAACALVAVWAYRRPIGSRVPRWTRPISYFYLMNYALLRGFGRFIRGRQPVTWERAPAVCGAAGVSTARDRSAAASHSPARVHPKTVGARTD